MKNLGNLLFFCGKMGAGKSTKSQTMAAKQNGILICEDEWLSAHYPDQIQTFDDYIKYSNLIKPFVKAHVQDLLKLGVSVVMDFPANTIKQRAWFKTLYSEVDCQHKLYYIDLTDTQCLAQIAKRRAEQPNRAHFDTEAVFHHVTQYFQPPRIEEGFNIVHLARGEDE